MLQCEKDEEILSLRRGETIFQHDIVCLLENNAYIGDKVKNKYNINIVLGYDIVMFDVRHFAM